MKTNNSYYYRYVSLKKLSHFLETKSLYLSRIDKFEDNLEGIDNDSLFKISFSKRKAGNKLLGEKNSLEIHKFQESILKKVKEELITRQKSHYASCWFISDHESMAMWDLYARNGFLIRYDKDFFEEKIDELKKRNISFTSKLVDYVNFNEIGFENGSKNSNDIDLFFRKSKAFINENEFRLIKKIDPSIDEYFLIEDFFQFIDFKIFASPRMSNLDFEIYFKHFQEKYEVEIRESEIKDIIQLRENNF